MKISNVKFQISNVQCFLFEIGNWKLEIPALQAGFTLIELIIVTALVSIIGMSSLAFYSRFFTQNAVSNTIDQLTSEFRKAQIYAMAGKQHSPWGVHNGSNQIVLFQGTSYAGRTAAFDETFSTNTNVVISGFSDIIFTPMTGTPSASPTITISGNGNTKTIAINAQGVVSRGNPTWYNNSWQYRKQITIDHTKVGAQYLDATSQAGNTGGNNNVLSWSHTVGTQNNRLLVVGIADNNFNFSVTSVSFGSQTLTKLTNQNCPTICGNELWYLVAPNSGTNTITVTFPSTVHYIAAGAVSLYNVNQSTPFGTSATASGTGTAPSVSVTATTNQLVVDSLATVSSTAPTAGGSQTQNWTGNSSPNVYSGGSMLMGSGGTTTMSWTTSNAAWSDIAVPINAASPSLSNFPVLVDFSSDTDLHSNAQSTGNDILFTDSTGQTKLNHEIESYTSGTGALVTWVNVPNLSASVDTILYMYYGNAAASNQQSVTSVWDSNYKGVYHLGGAGPSMADSTSNANTATNNGATAAIGQLDGGASFNGTSNTISLPTAGMPTTNLTLELWVNLPSLPGSGFHSVLLYGAPATSISERYYGTNTDFRLYTDNTYATDSSTITSSTPYHLVVTYDGTTTTWYMNGVSIFTQTGALGLAFGSILLGGDGASSFVQATIDEVRVSNTLRSSSWIATEYNNQNSPLTFYSVGTATTQ